MLTWLLCNGRIQKIRSTAATKTTNFIQQSKNIQTVYLYWPILCIKKMNQYFLTKRNNSAVRIQKVKIMPKIQFPLIDKLQNYFNSLHTKLRNKQIYIPMQIKWHDHLTSKFKVFIFHMLNLLNNQEVAIKSKLSSIT